jgi:hypothetical protein
VLQGLSVEKFHGDQGLPSASPPSSIVQMLG